MQFPAKGGLSVRNIRGCDKPCIYYFDIGLLILHMISHAIFLTVMFIYL